jgi:hypothetical protein
MNIGCRKLPLVGVRFTMRKDSFTTLIVADLTLTVRTVLTDCFHIFEPPTKSVKGKQISLLVNCRTMLA